MEIVIAGIVTFMFIFGYIVVASWLKAMGVHAPKSKRRKRGGFIGRS